MSVAARIAETTKSVRSYFNSGATRSFEWRSSQLKALKALLLENEHEIGRAIVNDLKKPKPEWTFAEISMPVLEINYTLSNLSSLMKPKKVSTPLALLPATSYIVPEPYGVVLIIAPFNYPIQLALIPLAAAIAAGNVAILKPSELTPSTSTLLAKLIPKYMDTKAIQVVEGAVEETTALLAQRWDYVFFTGSETVGRIVMRACAEFLTPCTLELGGKSPTIVDKNVDLVLAARRVVWGKMLNCGQTCVAPDYVYVDASIKKEFLEECKKNLKQFYGENPQTSVDFGRVVNERHTKRLESIINSHKDQIVAGGIVDVKEKYVAPTIIDLTNCTANNQGKVMEDEIFGPILPVLEYRDVKEVIDFINARPKPLALYVFSNSPEFQNLIVNSTSSGGVAINDTLLQLSNHDLPFGGVGSSGFGVYHGKYSFETFSHKKSVLNKSIYGDAPIRYPPYTNTGFAIFRWIGEVYRVNDESFKKFFKFVLLPALIILVAKKYGVSITFNSRL